MAPSIAEIPDPRYLHHFTRSSNPNYPSLTSVFALVINRARTLVNSSSNAFARSLSNRSTHRSVAAISKLSKVKRQQEILVIPTTYAHIHDSPSPGAVVGITLGAIIGFLLALLLMILAFRFIGGGAEIVEEEIVTRRSRHSHSKSVKKSTTISSSSDAPPIPEPEHEPEPIFDPEPEVVVMESRRSSRQSRRESRMSRRTSRMSRRSPEQVIVEEEMSSVHEAPLPREPEEVIVIEEESEVHTAEPVDEHVIVEEEEDDIVEVIEEHSPEPPPRRRSSAATRRSSAAFRTIDPAEYGGGDAPSRRISRQTNRS